MILRYGMIYCVTLMVKKPITVRQKKRKIYSNIKLAFFPLEIQLYLEYKQNRISLPSETSSGIAAPQDQSQIRQRISSSKTIATEVTEKSSIWDSASNCSRPGTGFVSLFYIELNIIQCILEHV